jgi:hypothetical protein
MEFGADEFSEQIERERLWFECLMTLAVQARFGSKGAGLAVRVMLEDRGRWLRN